MSAFLSLLCRSSLRWLPVFHHTTTPRVWDATEWLRENYNQRCSTLNWQKSDNRKLLPLNIVNVHLVHPATSTGVCLEWHDRTGRCQFAEAFFLWPVTMKNVLTRPCIVNVTISNHSVVLSYAFLPGHSYHLTVTTSMIFIGNFIFTIYNILTTLAVVPSGSQTCCTPAVCGINHSASASFVINFSTTYWLLLPSRDWF